MAAGHATANTVAAVTTGTGTKSLTLCHRLQLAAEAESARFSEPWVGGIVVCLETFPGSCVYADADLVEKCLDPLSILTTSKMRFSTEKYPVLPDVQSSLDQLRNDIIVSAKFNSGADITCNGHNSTTNKLTRVLVCSCARIYDQSKRSKLTGEFRRELLHNNRKGTRGLEGKKMIRRTDTIRRMTKDQARCPFRLTISADNDSLFVKLGIGCFSHQFHPRLDPLTQMRSHSRLLNTDQTELFEDLAESNATAGVARNLHFTRTGNLLSCQQMAYIFNRSKKKGANAHSDKLSSTDKMIECIKSKKARYCLLTQANPPPPELSEFAHTRNINNKKRKKVNGTNIQGPADTIPNLADTSYDNLSSTAITGENEMPGTLANETSSFGTDGLINVEKESLQHLSAQELLDVKEYAQTNRSANKLKSNQTLMMAVAFTLPEELDLFRIFPNVLHIDCTADTNIEQRPLLTASGFTAEGKMFTALRAYLPNERAWVFRWLFQHVFPHLLGAVNLKLTKVMLTDGDSSETSQLDQAILKFFTQVRRRRCVWHIVDRGFYAHVNLTRDGNRQLNPKFTELRQLLQVWMFTWAWRGYCYFERQLLVSKCLFVAFVNSTYVSTVLGKRVAAQVMKLLRNHVEPHEDLFVFCRHKDYFNLDTSSNSAHEGTNNGLKKSTAAVKPQHNLDKSTEILTTNGQIKSLQTRINVAKKNNSTKLWSNSPTSSYLGDKGEGILQEEWKSSSPGKYFWLEIGRTTWLLLTTNTAIRDGVIPQFRNVWKITRSVVTGALECSCCLFPCQGIPCRHIMFVCRIIFGLEYLGPSHYEIRSFWWQSSMYHGLSTTPHHDAAKKLHEQLRCNETCGPTCSPNASAMSSSTGLPLECVTAIFGQPTLDLLDKFNSTSLPVCWNYSEEAVKVAVQACSDIQCDGVMAPPFMTQESVLDYGSDGSGFVDGVDGDMGESAAASIQFPGMPAVAQKETSNYQVIMPAAKEIVALLDGLLPEDRKRILKQMHNMTIDLKKRHSDKRSATDNGNSPAGTYVSAMPATNKRRRTHGTQNK